MIRIGFAALLVACSGGDEVDDKDTDMATDTEDTEDSDAMEDSDMMDSDTMAMPSDEELAAALWAELAGFETWPQAAPWTGVQYHSDTSPHGPWVQIWLNTTAEADWDGVSGGGAFRDGAILVKRLYDDADGTSVKPEIFAMWKVHGYDCENGDWFWAKYDEAGVASPAGKVDMCSSCHASGKDYSRIATDVPGDPL